MMRLVLLCWLVAASACASVPERKVDLPMPEAYDFAREAAARAETDAQWWREFEDGALNALTEEALAANQDIAAGLAAVKTARASVSIANATLFPQLGASASAGSDTKGLDDISASARASAFYQLDLFGRNGANRAAAKAAYDAQKFDQRALELTVASDVAFTYFSILAARERLAVARSNLEISERIFGIVETKYRAGAVSGFDVASQEAARANARARLPQVAQQLTSLETALAVLLGKPSQGYSAPEGALLSTEPPPINSGLPSDLLLRRPDLLSAQAQLRVAGADVAAAKAAFLPTIDLGAGVSAALTGGTSAIGSLAASLSAPIFSGGRLEGGLAGAKAREDQQVARFRQAVLIALREVDVSLSALATAEEREQQLAAANDAAAKSLSLAEILYRAGRDDLTSLLTAQQTAFNAADALAQGRLDRLSAAIDLYVAIGGGWMEGSTRAGAAAP